MRYFEEAKRGRRIASFVLSHTRNISTFDNYSCNKLGWLFDTVQSNDIQRILPETTQGPHASDSLNVLMVFTEFKIK